MRIEDHLRQSAGRFGSKTALIAGETRLTYLELDRLSGRLATGLIARGLREGDRVVMVAENCAEAVVAFFACWKAGAVPCPLHASIKRDKLRVIIDSTKPFAVLAQTRFCGVVDAAFSDAGRAPLKISFGAVPASGASDAKASVLRVICVRK